MCNNNPYILALSAKDFFQLVGDNKVAFCNIAGQHIFHTQFIHNYVFLSDAFAPI